MATNISDFSEKQIKYAQNRMKYHLIILLNLLSSNAVMLSESVLCMYVLPSLQVDYYRVCVIPLLKRFLPDNNLHIKVCVSTCSSCI